MENVVNYKTKLDDETSAMQSGIDTNDYSTIVEKSMIINNKTTPFDLYKGFIFMFFSCFFKSLFSILCKVQLERDKTLSSFQLLMIKAYLMLGITIIVSFYNYFSNNHNIFLFSKNNLNLIILRAILSILSMSVTIFSLKYISISEVYSIYYIYPGIVILFSYFILNEKVGVCDFLCLLFCFIGVILIIRPEIIFPKQLTSSTNLLIFILVVIGASLKAFEDIIIRNVGKEIDCLIVPSIYSIIAIVMYTIPFILFHENSKIIPEFTQLDWIIVMFISIFSFIYQTFMTLGIQSENAGRVSMVNYLQVFFMFLSDLIIFHRRIIFLDVLGTGFILVFNLINGVRKAMKRGDQLNIYKSKQIEVKNI